MDRVTAFAIQDRLVLSSRAGFPFLHCFGRSQQLPGFLFPTGLIASGRFDRRQRLVTGNELFKLIRSGSAVHGPFADGILAFGRFMAGFHHLFDLVVRGFRGH